MGKVLQTDGWCSMLKGAALDQHSDLDKVFSIFERMQPGGELSSGKGIERFDG